MSLRKQKTPARGLSATDKAVNFGLALYDSPKQADCQPCQLSPDSLSRAGLLIGDLGVFLLGRLPRKGLPDPNFYPLFEKALFYLELEETLLQRAAALELAQAGE